MGRKGRGKNARILENQSKGGMLGMGGRRRTLTLQNRREMFGGKRSGRTEMSGHDLNRISGAN